MFCSNCGNQVGDAKFCSACGAQVNPTPETNPEPEVVPAPEVNPIPEETPAPEAEPVFEAAPTAQSVAVPEPVNAYSEAPVDPGKSGGKTALILGIVALALGTICSCLLACLGGIIPLGCAIAGIIVGSQAMKKSQAAGFTNSQAKTGVILSAVAIGVIVIFVIINAIVGGVLAASGYSLF